MKSSPLPAHLIQPVLYAQTSYPLATSAASHVPQRFVLPSNITVSKRELCTDQKGFFDHLKSRSLMISTFRVCFLQASQVFTGYLTDQLHHESKLEEELTDGKISSLELEIRNSHWEEVEWDKRIKTIPHKIKTALVKYHALMLLMRFYEKVIGLMVEKALMEKLTKDAFKSAVHKSRSIEAGERKPDGYAREMFETCVYSNFISFLADYSIQQSILAYGYYLYIKNARKERKFNALKKKEDELNLDYKLSDFVEDDLFIDPNADDIVGDDTSKTNVIKNIMPGDSRDNDDSASVSSFNPEKTGVIIYSLVYKSCHLIIARAIGLFMAGVGGAFGSSIRPGWGTVVGVQLGDACASVVLDD